MAVTASPVARRSLLTDALFGKTQEWLAPLYQHSDKPPKLDGAHEVFGSIVGLVEPALEKQPAFQQVLEFQARWASRDIGNFADIYQAVRRRRSNLVNTFVSVTYGRALWMIETSRVDPKAFLVDTREVMADPAAAAKRLQESVRSLGDDFLGHVLATTEMLAAEDQRLAMHLDNVSSLFRGFRPEGASEAHEPKKQARAADSTEHGRSHESKERESKERESKERESKQHKSNSQAGITALTELGLQHRTQWHFIPAHVALAMAAWK